MNKAYCLIIQQQYVDQSYSECYCKNNQANEVLKVISNYSILKVISGFTQKKSQISIPKVFCILYKNFGDFNTQLVLMVKIT